MDRPRHIWTKAETERLVALRAAGLSNQQAADELGVSLNAVISRARYANLPLKRTKNHKWTEAQVQQLIDLRAKGLTVRQVADQMGLPYTVVQRKVTNARLPRRRYTFINLNVERSEKIQRYYSLIRVKTLCMSLDISPGTLYKALDKLHIKRKYKSWNR